MLKLRLPLIRNEEMPHGGLQPYIAAGPAVFITRAKHTGVEPPNQSDSDVSLGVKVGAGVNYQITKLIGIFGGYRYTRFRSSLSYRDETPSPSIETFKATFDTHQLIAILSLHFN